MTTDRADGAQRTPFVRNFQDRITLIECDGRPVVVAREFGAMLDYADNGNGLVDLITARWADEFIPDVDSILLKNGRLAEFKKVCASLGLALVDKRAPSLLLLTQSGIQLVLARSEKPEGKTFRRWLVSEAIPGYEAARRGELPPGAHAPRVEGPVAEPPAPPTPPAPRRSRSHRPASSYGTARDLLELLDRYRRGRVIDAGAWHALRALAEHLDARPTPETIALPRTSTHRLLLGPVAGDLDAQIAAVLGPPPPEDSLRSSTYTTTASALKVGAECRARRARGELSEFTNMHRWFALNVWIGWIQRGHLSVERFDLLLTRIEDLADELIGPMPSLRTTGGR